MFKSVCTGSQSSSVLLGSFCRVVSRSAQEGFRTHRLAKGRFFSMSSAALQSPTTNELRFDLTPQEIKAKAEEYKGSIQALLDGIASLKDGEHTFENTVKRISDFDGDHAGLETAIDFPQYVSTDKEIREASCTASTMLQDFGVECSMRLDVYQSLQKFASTADLNKLTPTEQRLVKHTLRDFERNGLALPQEKREQLQELKKELSKVQIDFQKNLVEEVTKVLVEKDDLEGLPEDFINSLEKEGDKLVVTLKYPHLIPILERAKKSSTRELFDLKNASKCNEENVPLINKALLLRRQIAELLGKEDHASHVLEIRMAKKPSLVLEFLEELSKKLDGPMQKELEMWKKLKAEVEPSEDASVIHSHDWNYLHTLNLERNYQVDDEESKPYFPIDVVTDGMLGVYQDLLSLRFQEIAEPHVWHEDVRMFAVHDADTSDFLGHFYLDLHPRDGKYGHAAAFPMLSRYLRNDGSIRRPVSAMVANFTKPTAEKPSLLQFNEVVTYFHELGHVLHGMCTTVVHHRFSGTRVERDFVEAPSQMLENWCYEEEVLNRISGHFKDNSKKLPSEILKKLVAAKNADTGLMNKRQIFFGVFDQTIHSSKEESIDTGVLYAKLRKEITAVAQPEGTNSAASFGHLMGGYDASYYGYLWSQVYSADMFGLFKERGIMNKELGRKYRDIILGRGGSVDSMDSIKEFLGRKPTQEAFLRSIGIKQ